MKFVDSNIFIYELADDPDYGEQAHAILKRIEAGEATTTSTVVIAQVCAYLGRRKRFDTIPSFLTLLRSLPSLTKTTTSYSDFIEAEDLQTQHQLSWSLWDDIVIAAQMRRLGLAEIYSNDDDFDQIPGIKRVFKER